MARRVFLDASALFAAAYSPDGAMRVLIRLTAKGFYLLYSNEIAIEEAERNLQSKAPEAIGVFRTLLTALPIVIRPAPKQAEFERARTLVGAEDAPLLAGAIERRCELLVTVDRQHLVGRDVCRLAPNLTIATPGDILRMAD
jgi:predicted nucleic acid-binding protein